VKKEQQVSMKIEVVLRALFSLVLCDFAMKVSIRDGPLPDVAREQFLSPRTQQAKR